MEKINYNFDEIIDRHHTCSIKYDKLKEMFGREDILPMWVADMDFKTPEVVLKAVDEIRKKGVLGYSFRSSESINYFAKWLENRHNWKVNPDWISYSPGVVSALSFCVRLFTNKGDKILIQTPVYPPFYSVVSDNNRELVCSALNKVNNKYEINWEDFESKLSSGVSMFILCSPHNPVGRLWTKSELLKIGNLCIKYNVLIVSDEIHADLALFDNKHIPIASISEEIADITITCMAPSKTFNIAGVFNSNVIIKSKKMLDIYEKEINTLHLNMGNIFGHITMEYAYKYGEDWLNHMIKYLEGNINYTLKRFATELPEITIIKPEASFLLWLDFSQTGKTHKEVYDILINKAKVGLNNGLMFGKGGKDHFRMNIGCPRSVVEEGINRIIKNIK